MNVAIYKNNNFGQTRHMDKIEVIIMMIIPKAHIFIKSGKIMKKVMKKRKKVQIITNKRIHAIIDHVHVVH